MSKIEDLVLSNTTKILEAIEELVWQLDISYIDASVKWCEDHNLEIEVIAPILKKNSKFKNLIAIEAEGLNYLPKTTRILGID